MTVIDFEPLRRKQRTIQEIAEGLDGEKLARLTNEMCDLQLEAIADAEDADVVFVPYDPEAKDVVAASEGEVELAWTLGHVVVHATASSEESAALALTLARGLSVEGRSRYEVPWQEATTAAFCRHRIEESRRMRLAMLAAWPSSPHLDNVYQPYESWPAMNAIGRFITGLFHDDDHLPQLRKIMVQARARRSGGAPSAEAGDASIPAR